MEREIKTYDRNSVEAIRKESERYGFKMGGIYNGMCNYISIRNDRGTITLYVDVSLFKTTPKIEINWAALGSTEEDGFKKWHKEFGNMIKISEFVKKNIIVKDYDRNDTYENWEISQNSQIANQKEIDDTETVTGKSSTLMNSPKASPSDNNQSQQTKPKGTPISNARIVDDSSFVIESIVTELDKTADISDNTQITHSHHEKHGDTLTQQCCRGIESEEGQVSNSNDSASDDTSDNTKKAKGCGKFLFGKNDPEYQIKCGDEAYDFPYDEKEKCWRVTESDRIFLCEECATKTQSKNTKKANGDKKE